MPATKLFTSDHDSFEDRGAIVTVSFGSQAGQGVFSASTTVTGLPWVTSSTRFVATLVGTASRSVEEALLEGLRVGVNNIVSGVGFDVIVHAPNGAHGDFTVHVVGV